jgi:epothilone polyketide synthase D
VVHAAGVLDDGILSEQTPERFARVIVPKVAGACHLDALTRGADLDFFLLFSSLSATLGSPGQAPYTAANAALDALAAQRHSEGLPAQSLAWGPWAEGGMAASLDAAMRARMARHGVKPLSTSTATALLDAVLDRQEPGLVLAQLDLSAASKALGSLVPPIWRALLKPQIAAATTRDAWVQELAALPPERRLEAVLDVVRVEIARGLSLPGPHAAPSDRPLQDLGLDSLTAVEIRNALSQRAGTKLLATFAFDHPTPLAMARFLLEKVLCIAAPDAAGAPADDATFEEFVL